MDATLVDDLHQRISYEGDRTGPPDGFPKLPDIALARYTDPDFHRQEIDQVFKRRWLFACHVSEVPGPGNYKVLDLPFAPVVVVHGTDGIVRAFLNACRHRGAPVVREACGKAKHLVCQYHAWSYDLSGNLVGVPDQRDFVGLETDQRGLAPVRCEQWGGIVFVNLDPEARPLLEDFAPLVRRYSDVMEADLRLVESRSWDIRCNWKLGIEAFTEVYHVRFVHSKSGGHILDARRAAMQLHPHGHSAMFIPFREEALARLGNEYLDLFFPPNARRLPDPTGIYQNAAPALLGFPNFIPNLDVSGFPVLLFWPTAVDRCRFDVHWYAPDWGDTEKPEGWDPKAAIFDVLFNEDVANLEPIQRSIESAAHTGVPLSYQERRLWQFHVELDRQIGVENIPELLRVPALLDDYVED